MIWPFLFMFCNNLIKKIKTWYNNSKEGLFMNKNIFSPRGYINQTLFIVYYFILIALYIFGGLYVIIFVYKHNLNSLYFLLPFFLIRLLMVFNYKKRVLDITGNLVWSVVWGIILGFDSLCLPACSLIKDKQTSLIVFFGLLIFIIFIQPAIVAMIPGKENKENEQTN